MLWCYLSSNHYVHSNTSSSYLHSTRAIINHDFILILVLPYNPWMNKHEIILESKLVYILMAFTEYTNVLSSQWRSNCINLKRWYCWHTFWVELLAEAKKFSSWNTKGKLSLIISLTEFSSQHTVQHDYQSFCWTLVLTIHGQHLTRTSVQHFVRCSDKS